MRSSSRSPDPMMRSSLRALAVWQDDPRNSANEHFFDQLLIEGVGEEAWAREHVAATRMGVTETIHLAQSLVSGSVSAQHPDSRARAPDAALQTEPAGS